MDSAGVSGMNVYHASPDSSLKAIAPKRTMSKDVYIGDFVFATTDKKLAAMYLATRGVATLMHHASDTPFIVMSSSSGEYLQSDAGGAIYTLPGATFEPTPQHELSESEMVSRVMIEPLHKEVYKTSIEAMKRHGITIYFVDQPTFERIVAAKNQQEAVSTLQPFFRPQY